jgi:hypothetical protein
MVTGEARRAQDGMTALHLAAEGGHESVVDALMHAVVDVTAKDMMVNARDNVRARGVRAAEAAAGVRRACVRGVRSRVGMPLCNGHA